MRKEDRHIAPLPMSPVEKETWRRVVQTCEHCDKYRFKADLVVIDIDGAQSEVCFACAKLVESRIISRLAYKHRMSEEWAIFLANKYRDSVSTLEMRHRRSRYLTHTICLDHLYGLFAAQRGLCALTGREMTCKRGHYAASIDRINNSKGYEPGNVWWVCSVVNIMKHTLSVADLADWCTAVTVHMLESADKD